MVDFSYTRAVLRLFELKFHGLGLVLGVGLDLVDWTTSLTDVRQGSKRLSAKSGALSERQLLHMKRCY